MHQFARYLQERLDARGLNANDLARASGISATHIGRMLKDDRPYLPELPNRDTLAKLATALRRPVAEVTYQAAQAYGVPGLNEPLRVPSPEDASDDDLLRELATRLHRHAGTAPLDVNLLEDKAIPQLLDLLDQLQTGADEDYAAGDAGLATTKRWLAEQLEAALQAAQRAKQPTTSPDQPAKP